VKKQQSRAAPEEGWASLKSTFDRANAEYAAGRSKEAEAICREILDRDDEHFGAWHLLAILALRQGEREKALAHIEKAISIAPTRADCQNSLGFVLRSLQRDRDAEAAFQRAVTLDQDFTEAHYQLANLYRESRRYADAEASYRRVLALSSGHYQAHNHLGVVLGEFRRFDEAATCLRHALAIRPNYAEACINLGHVLRSAGQPEAAEAACRQALAIASDMPVANLNLGLALQDLLRLDEALDCFRRASPADGSYPKAAASEAIVHLLRGDFAAGWEKYEARWRIGDLPPRGFVQPQWRGEPAAGKIILLHAEQGFGDTIQFLRYVPLVAARGLKIILEIQKPLLPLAAGLGAGATIVARGERLPAFDLHCPLLSLPLAFGTTLGTIPATTPYLSAAPERIADWRRRLATGPGLKIGIAWAGSPVHRNDIFRSIPFAHLMRLFDLTGTQYFSLQVGPRAAELSAAQEAVIDLSPELVDFGETAAAIANFDLVIAADTAVAHLAGALNKPVWTMLPFAPDWRWLLGRADSPWYASMQLFRQARPGDWDRVVQAVRNALLERLAVEPEPRRSGAARAEYVALVKAANEHHSAKRHAECEAVLRRALAIDPTNASAWHVLALSRYELGHKEEGIELLQKAIQLAPEVAIYFRDLAIMLFWVRQNTRALDAAREAVRLGPDDASAHNAMAASLAELDRSAEAIVEYRKALALKPDYFECWTSLAHAHQSLLQLDEAADCCRRALGICYDHPEAQCAAAMLALLRGDYVNGFTQFEWRWRLKILQPRDFAQPLWQGEQVEGKTILLHAEQGLGDTLQCLRFVPEVIAKSGRVILELPQPLVKLATSLAGGGEIVPHGVELPKFDVHCAFMSLPRVLGVSVKNLRERQVPYLRAEPAAIERWARRLAGTGSGLRVGLAWAGNPMHAGDRRRSIAIEKFAELVKLPSVRFYALQVGERAQDLALLPPGRVINLAPELNDFAETAAALANLDLLITVDSAIAHLAGSIGRPCWVMLPFSPDWRWLTGRSDSAWYPVLRLFRQNRPGDWDGVFQHVEAELASLAGARQSHGPAIDADLLFRRAWAEHQAGRQMEAEKISRGILPSDPDHRPTLNLLGVLRESAGDHKEAADLLARLAELEPDNADAHYNLGSVFGALDRTAEAIESYRCAIALKPDHAKAHNNLGSALRTFGKLDEAEAMCRRAVALDPASASALVNLGSVLATGDRLEEAEATFQDAVAREPTLAEGHLNLGLVLHNQGRPQEALAHYQRALAIRSDYADAHMAEAFALLALRRDFPTALEKLEWRWRLPGRIARQFRVPQWHGEALNGKTILLHTEQWFWRQHHVAALRADGRSARWPRRPRSAARACATCRTHCRNNLSGSGAGLAASGH
jgi:tetratricopeptide (TPR) repeat protein